MDYLSRGSGGPHLEATNRYQRRIGTTRSWTGNGQAIGLGDLIVPRQLPNLTPDPTLTELSDKATPTRRPSTTKQQPRRHTTKLPDLTPGPPPLRLVAPEPEVVHDARGDLDWFFSRATTIRHGACVHIGIAGPVDAVIACSVLRATSPEWTEVDDDDFGGSICPACLITWYGWIHDERIAAIAGSPTATSGPLVRRLLAEAR